MSNSSTTVSSGGFGLTTAVFLVFLVLKLTGTGPVADWSWWWVTSPLWIPYALLMIAGVVGLVILGILRLFESTEKRKIREARASLRNYARNLR